MVLQRDVPQPTDVVVVAGLRKNRLRPPLPLAEFGAYRWEVTASDGFRSTESEVWSFSTVERAIFKRGDSSVDGVVGLADAVKTLLYLYLDGDAECLDAMDANDDGEVDLQDPLLTLFFLFEGIGEIPAPKQCGVDPTEDDTGTACGAYPLDSCL